MAVFFMGSRPTRGRRRRRGRRWRRRWRWSGLGRSRPTGSARTTGAGRARDGAARGAPRRRDAHLPGRGTSGSDVARGHAREAGTRLEPRGDPALGLLTVLLRVGCPAFIPCLPALPYGPLPVGFEDGLASLLGAVVVGGRSSDGAGPDHGSSGDEARDGADGYPVSVASASRVGHHPRVAWGAPRRSHAGIKPSSR